jgi:hypothetical protein
MPNVVIPGSPEAQQAQVQAGAEDDVDLDDDANDDGADDDSGAGGAGDEAVTFASKQEFVKHVNGIVKKRLQRNEQKYAPIVAERDTLKKRVAELEPAQQGQASSVQQIEALSKQVSDLLSYQQTTQRNELVRSIAKDHGLPDEFFARVKGDDEDSITEDVEELVELLKIDTKNPGTQRPPKNTKPEGKDGKGGKGSGGKGGAEDDDKNDPAAIAKAVGRYGHRPIFVG